MVDWLVLYYVEHWTQATLDLLLEAEIENKIVFLLYTGLVVIIFLPQVVVRIVWFGRVKFPARGHRLGCRKI